MSESNFNNLYAMLEDPQVILYFAVLIASMSYCFLNSKRWQVLGSLAAMSLTWFYICRWMVEYKLHGGNNMFDDAYIDTVIPPHWKASSQLLTWVVVGSVWMHEANPCYMLFGMLGAMSASFLCWVPNKPMKSSAEIPIAFVVTSAIALYSIFKLPRSVSAPTFTSTTTSTDNFAYWLKLLHVVLVAPQLLSPLAAMLPTVSGTPLYATMAVLIAAGHWAEADPNTTISTFFTMPVTDCQLSITFDLVLCSAISLYAIYQQTRSVRSTTGCALLMFVLSPGSVLAGFLAVRSMLCDPTSQCTYANVVTSLQQHTAILKSGGKQHHGRVAGSKEAAPKVVSGWMNLGAWGECHGAEEESYSTACERLANVLGRKVFGRTKAGGDRVLACGCGYGAELKYWKETFGLRHITGIDTNEDAVNHFVSSPGVRMLHASVRDLVAMFGEHRSGAAFNKIVALDCIYHFPDKVQFFRDCVKVLQSCSEEGGGGQSDNVSSERGVGYTDIVLCDNLTSTEDLPLWLRFALRLMDVRVSSLWGVSQYKSELLAAGFESVEVETVNVLGNWLPPPFLRYLSYAVISANLPTGSTNVATSRPRRPRVAVIGSGLAGLTTARLLSPTHNVVIFEAKESTGLSGQGVQVGNQFVDIPLRIIGRGYYSYVENLTRSLGVSVRPIRESDFLTQFNYGTSSPMLNSAVSITASGLGSGESFDFSNNWLSNVWAALPHLSDLKRFNECVYKDRLMMQPDGMSSGDSTLRCETWGEWMARHNYDSDRYKGGVGSSTDSFVMWLLMGSASWMLSTTYEATLKYPAHIILGFARSLHWGEDVADVLHSSASKSGRMMRVKPSMQALENALSYGLEVRCGVAVKGLTADKLVNGEQFDFVIIATEASAIKHIVAPALLKEFVPAAPTSIASCTGDVFSRIQYQSSTIYVHRDESLMPTDRRNWRTFNMCQNFGYDTCSLTAWLNDYYPEADFASCNSNNSNSNSGASSANLFQTWNPYNPPAPDLTIKVSHFQRVVHTAETPSILADIAAVQGKVPGIYFAGAYTFPGMGLLEQAARSGKRAADLVQEVFPSASHGGTPALKVRSKSPPKTRARAHSPAASTSRQSTPKPGVKSSTSKPKARTASPSRTKKER